MLDSGVFMVSKRTAAAKPSFWDVLGIYLALAVIGCGSTQAPTLYSMQEKYVGEHLRVEKPIRYLSTTEEREKHKLHVRDGLLVGATGTPLDPDLKNNPMRDGFAIFVMDAKGDIYLSFDHKRDVFHHSSLLAGASVAAAGDMTIIDGKLLAISNSSGHYRPPPDSLDRVLQRLSAMGIPVDKVKVTRVDSKSSGSR